MKIIRPLILSVDFSMCVTMHRKKLEGFVGMVRKVCKLLHICLPNSLQLCSIVMTKHHPCDIKGALKQKSLCNQTIRESARRMRGALRVIILYTSERQFSYIVRVIT